MANYYSTHEGKVIDDSVQIVQNMKPLEGYIYGDGEGNFVGRTVAVDLNEIAQQAAEIVLGSLIDASKNAY